MQEQAELKTNFTALENRIQKMILLHEQLKNHNQALLAENRRILLELEDIIGEIDKNISLMDVHK